MRNAALLTALVYMTSGCAALTKSAPKSDNPADPPRCSESRGAVVVDGIFAGMYGLGGMLALSEDAGGAALLMGALGAVHVASAVSGNRAATRCTKANEAHEAWLASEATRPPIALERDEIMGVAGSTCYPNKTCNAGLTCDPSTNLCALPAATAAKPAPTPTTPTTTPAPATTTPTTPTAPATTTPTTTTAPATTTPTTTTAPATTTANRPSTPAPAAPPADTRSDRAQPGSDQPEPRPGRVERPSRRPTPPQSDEPWGAFWREVK